MRYQSLGLIAAGIATVLSVSPVFAADPPTTRCVTASTKAAHASYDARLEKDVAPYASNEDAAKAVKAYRDGVAVAWDAMLEPYCGYGTYGAKSAIKSYTKSVDRERAAFLVAVKRMKSGSEISETSEISVPVQTTVKAQFSQGLHRGMRSEKVLELQKWLVEHFKLDADDYATGFFGPKTEGLVIRFQKEKKLVKDETSPGAGLVGPRTAEALNED